MAAPEPSPAPHEARVVMFRRRGIRPRISVRPPVEDLAKYERAGGSDDYRHRMAINAAALLFVVGLIAAGLWIAETMAAMRKNQDCVLSGRRGCTPVQVEHNRW